MTKSWAERHQDDAIAMMTRRDRRIYAALALGTIGLGLLGRRAAWMPSFFAANAGDALYATLVFWLLAIAVPLARAQHLAIVTFCACAAIELSQAWHAEWLLALRRTALGPLVLGTTFAAEDFPRYLAGVAIALIVDRHVRGWRPTR
ncbi:MAG: DUF2809 domain-containing protein [Deltaproteobacteria bacterium]|nr:DUF2809 domain-containing protein [Deltaproteobacteria bacterium]